MVDEDLILKKLAFIETCVRDLQTLANVDRLDTDIREQRFIVHTLQLAAQASLDVASHIVSDRRLGEPRTNRQLFELLGRAGWMTPELTIAMRNLAGFRNVVVRGYDEVDLRIVKDVVQNRLIDFMEFADAIRAGLEGP